MSNEMNTQAAKAVYEMICEMLDDKELKYARHDDDLVISCGVRGEDLPIDLLFMVRGDRQIVQLISPLSFKIDEDKRLDAAVAVAVANYGLVNGSFDYDISDGEIRFRMTQSFIEHMPCKEVFHYMLLAAYSSIDQYNDLFLMLNKGLMTLEQFITAERTGE